MLNFEYIDYWDFRWDWIAIDSKETKEEGICTRDFVDWAENEIWFKYNYS